MKSVSTDQIKQKHLEFATQRGTEKTYCPSEVARSLWPDTWKSHMNKVREVADLLIEEQQLVVLQKGIIQESKATECKGPIRLQRKK